MLVGVLLRPWESHYHYVVHEALTIERVTAREIQRRALEAMLNLARKLGYVLTAETAFSGAMLERSQYAPSSNSSNLSIPGEDGDAGDEDLETSLMLSMMVCTSTAVGGNELSPFSVAVSLVHSFGRTIAVSSAIMKRKENGKCSKVGCIY